MDRDKQLKIVLGVVILIFAVMVLTAILKPRHKKAAAPAQAAAQEEVAQKAEAPKQRKTSSFKDWGRDPFTMGTSAVELSGDLVLSGIIWDAKKPYCIINEKVVKIGDGISGYKILEINKDSVTVESGDGIRILKVGRK